jgi:hypothetical protein
MPGSTREQVLYLGRLLKLIWQAKLVLEFPGRDIMVSFPEDLPEGLSDDLLQYQITFYQNRPSKAVQPSVGSDPIAGGGKSLQPTHRMKGASGSCASPRPARVVVNHLLLPRGHQR